MSRGSGIWQLVAQGYEPDIIAAGEQLGFLEASNALYINMFGVDPGWWQLEAGYSSCAEAEAAKATLNPDFQLDVAELPDTDWVREVQKQLDPSRGGRFLLYGSHDRDTVGERLGTNDIGIEVEAGPAFGSGHHPTTQGCLEVLTDLLEERDYKRALDVGCGTGVLAIAVALVTDAEVVASDIDPDAVEVAQETAELNGADITVHLADGLDHPALAGPFDLVIANILAGPLEELAPDIAKATADGSLLVLSGLLDEQADSIISAYNAHGFAGGTGPSREGWRTLVFHKPPLTKP